MVNVDRTIPITPAALEPELHMVREAIAMVASRGAVRVTLANIRFGEALVDSAGALALDAGVRLKALPRDDGAGMDVAVERIRE